MDKPKGSGIRITKLAALAAALSFLAGAAFGVMRSVKIHNLPGYDRLVENFNVTLKVNINYWDMGQSNTGAFEFTAGFVDNVKLPAAIWFLAFLPPLAPFVLAMLFGKGLMLGFAAGLIWAVFGETGLLYAAVLLLPGNLVMLPACLYVSYGSLCHITGSVRAWLIMRRAGGERLTGRLRWSLSRKTAGPSEYAAFLAAAVVCSAAAALVEVYLTPAIWELIVRSSTSHIS